MLTFILIIYFPSLLNYGIANTSQTQKRFYVWLTVSYQNVINIYRVILCVIKWIEEHIKQVQHLS